MIKQEPMFHRNMAIRIVQMPECVHQCQCLARVPHGQGILTGMNCLLSGFWIFIQNDVNSTEREARILKRQYTSQIQAREQLRPPM